ncbi:uroporphyrinogen decarboxylase, partial [Soehngenia saccharolytica]
MGKDLIMKVLRHEKCDEIPWVPFAGVHAGFLKGHTAKDVLVDADKLYESLLEVHKLYTPDGMPIVFDLQIEAEILGCDLMWAEDNPPSVMTHPFEDEMVDPSTLKLPDAKDGRIPMVLDVMRRMKAAVGENTALYGLICGPLTLASHLRGSEFFTDMFDEPEYVEALIDYCANVNIRMADLYIEAGMDVIGVVDPLVSQVSPSTFEELLAKGFVKVFDHIRKKGSISSFFVCGNATQQMKVMCDTHPDCISVDENVDLVEAKKITDQYNITIGGNIPLTTTMLFGNQKDNMKFVVDLLDNITHDNLIISPGCDMPYNIPTENTIAAAFAVKQTESARNMVAGYEAVDDDIEIELPDYSALTKPLIEVFTLDSATCAACTYMLASAMQAKQEFGDDVDVVEYKYTIREDIAR